ncbi:hypothetical protein [Stomatohabitans albus]|uniref:SWIM zinc finger family protein n=1 Tax=Stomatohabitans albus TaxID=3110766 RepID=UPI00300D5E1A
MTSWSAQWMEALEGLPLEDDAKARRIRQGRATASSGRVQELNTSPGRLTARVQGGRPTPYLVAVDVPQLSNEEWAIIVDILATQVRLCARLLAGQEPEELADLAKEQGVDLIPSIADVTFIAGHGPDEEIPTVGVAVWAAMGQVLRQDPYPLLRVRGRARERLLHEISVARGRSGAPDGIPLSTLSPVGWTRARGTFEAVYFPSPTLATRQAPSLAALGDPQGWAGAMSALDLFGTMIEAASTHAEQLLDDQESTASP